MTLRKFLNFSVLDFPLLYKVNNKLINPHKILIIVTINEFNYETLRTISSLMPLKLPKWMNKLEKPIFLFCYTVYKRVNFIFCPVNISSQSILNFLSKTNRQIFPF